MQKKILAFVLAAMLTASAMPATALASIEIAGAEETAITALSGANTVDTFNGTIVSTGVDSTSVDGSLVGEVIGAGAAADNFLAAFDGNPETQSAALAENWAPDVDYWMGIKFPAAVKATEIRIAVANHSKIFGSYIQASNDGINWTTLKEFSDWRDYADTAAGGNWASGDTYKSIALSGDAEYTYFRYFNYDDQGGNWLDEFQVYGTMVGVVLPNTIDTYNGTINYSGIKATSVDGSLAGEVISGGVGYAAVSAAFDGDMTTQASFDANYGTDVSNWMGMKSETPVIPLSFRLAASSASQQSKIAGSYIQASNDGVNWTTLWQYSDWREYATPAEGGTWAEGTYKVISVSTTETYQYFRYFNYNDDGANRLTEFQVVAVEPTNNTIDVYEGDIVYTGITATPIGGSVAGEIIGGGADASALAPAFDGNLSTLGSIGTNVATDVSYWMGLKMEEAIVPTAFALTLPEGQHFRIMGSYIQGSNDGVNWTTLEVFDDWRDYATPDEGGVWFPNDNYKFVEVDTTEAYQYYRYFNYADQGGNRLGEFLVFADGAAVAGAENNVVKYNGDIVYTGVMSTVDEGLRAAEIIGAGVDASAITGISDGSSATGALLADNGEAIDIWVGLKFAAPVVAREIKFKVPDGQANFRIMGSYFQGSNDGVNWETIKVINNWRDYATPAEGGNWAAGDYKFIEPNGQAYQYYRYFNRTGNGSNRIGEFQVVVSDGWMTPDYVEIDVSTRDNTAGTLSMTESEDGETVTISYELADGTVVTYDVPNNAQYIAGPLAGTDDLGRDMYTMEDVIELYENVDSTHNVGVVADDHEVGIFYFLLHGHHGDAGKLNITDILAEGGEAAKSANYEGWGNVGDIHYVAEPLYGYYYSEDEWVIRKHMELLTNAGVDFLYFDMTNGYADRYLDEIITIMSVLHEMNLQGYDAPEVVAYTNTNAGQTIATLYDGIYSKNLYPDTWYMVDGKPLVIAPADQTVSGFFTVRYTQWPTEAKLDNAWPWIDWNVAQDVFVNADGEAEAMNVSVAQHSGVNGEGGWFSESGVYGLTTNRGRSWVAAYDANGNYAGTRANTTADSYKNGYNFQSQFNYAISKDVPVVLVTGWNEWVAQRLDPSVAAVTGDDDRVVFVDNATLEFSRDIEMTRGYYFDNYYMQLAANVQALKGAAPDVIQDMRKTINTTGEFSQWNDVIVTYTDVEGDTINRAHMGYGQEYLTDESGRNDIVAAKVTADNTNLYFYVQTADDVTYFDNASSWMKLYVNVDRDTTGWYGYDFLITDTITSETTAKVAALSASGKTEAGEATIRVAGNEMMVAVPLSVLGISNYKNIDIEFKWADSETVIDEMEDFYTEGDAAPLGRMNYVFTNYKESTLIEDNTGKEPEVPVANTLTTYGGDIVYTGVQSTSVEGSLVGEVIGGGAAADALVNAFDGDLNTVTHAGSNFNDVVDYWFGLKLSEAVVPSVIRIAINPHYQIYKGYIQASNDGINWTTLKSLEDWKEYATPGEGGYWDANDDYRVIETGATTAYQYYRYLKYNDSDTTLSEFQVFGPDGIIVELPDNNLYTYEGEIVYTGTQNTSVAGSLVGEIILAGGEASAVAAVFDGDTNTRGGLGDNLDDVVDYWYGLKLTEAVVPTAFRVAAPAGQHHIIYKGYIQASNDGVNWTTLKDFENWREYADTVTEGGYWPKADVYKDVTVSTTEAYQYYRYFKYNDGGNVVYEFQVFGPDGILVNGLNSYIGEIVYTGVQSTSVDGSLVGEVIGGGAAADALTAAFDGDTTTVTELTANSGSDVNYWFGLKFSAPVIPTSIRVAVEPHHNIYLGYIQASNDGIHWTTLKDFTNWREYATPAEGGYWAAEDTYKVVTIDTTEAYRYYRYFKYNDSGNRLSEFQVFGLSDHTHATTFTEKVDATCVATGNVAYYYCEGCGGYFADEACTTEITAIELPINPNNHTGNTEIVGKIDATTEAEGYTGDKVCADCRVVLEKGETIPVRVNNTLTTYGGDIVYTGVQSTSVEGSLVGEIIGGGAAADALVNAFDGDLNTVTNAGSNYNDVVDYWFGLKLPEAVVPSVIRIAVNPHYQIYKGYVQASKDGVNWTTLKSLEDWKEYATPGEGGYWDANDDYKVINTGVTTAYQYYRYLKYNDSDTTLSEFQVFGPDGIIVELPDNNLYTYEGEIVYTGVNSTSVEGSLVGEIIGAGAAANALTAAFDGDLNTITELTANANDVVENWFGIKLAEATVPTAFRVAIEPHHNIFKGYIQGSNDGINWTTIKDFENWREYATPSEGGYWAADETYRVITVNTAEAYQYYRYFKYNDSGNRLSEFQVFGPNGILNNSITSYIGDIVYTGVKSTSVDGSLVGEVIGGGAAADALLAAFDGNTTTITELTANSGEEVLYWFGLKFSAPVIPTSIRVAIEPHHNIYMGYVQASKDGVQWTTLKDFTNWREYATPAEGGYWAAEDTYKVVDITTEEEYQYFRYFKYNDGGNRLSEFQVFGLSTHTHAMTYTAAVDATCAATGNVAYYYCEGCDTYFADEAGTTVLPTVETPINPDNHVGETEIRGKVDATATTEGYTGDTWCLACETKIADGEVIPATGLGGTFGDAGTWELANGVLTIGGEGAIPNYTTSSASAPWGAYRAQITKIVIGSGITSIGNYAFYQMRNAATIEFEADSAVESIATGAFGYAGMTALEIPASVKTIDKNAFYYAAALETVTFEEGSVLESIGNYAFRACTALKTITFPERIVTIGSSILYQAAYESVVVAEGSVAHAYAVASKYNYTTYTGTYTGFCGESATWVLAADGTLYINGTGAMSDYTTSSASAPWGTKRAEVKAIVIGKGITHIGNYAFYNMKNLTSVTFEANSTIEKIGEGAFGQTTALPGIELPAVLKTIGEKAFQYSGIKTVTFKANSKLESIERFAFRNCASLESVYIPAKVLSIGDKILYAANADAKLLVPMNSLGQTYATTNKYNMVVREETLSGSCGPNATWTLTSDGTLTIAGTGSLNVFGTSYKTQPWGTSRAYIKKVVIGNGITDITNFAFYYCSAMESVEFEAGSSVKTINTSPFSYTGLKSIEIPASVQLIGKNAFAFNDNLTSVTFEEGSALKEIRNYAFQSNPALEYIYLPDSVETFGAVVIYLSGGTNASVDVALGTPAYRYAVAQNYRNIALRGTEPSGSCGENATWAFDYATGVLTINGSGAMADYAYSSASAKAAPYACTLLNLRSFVTKIVIGSDITSIGEYAFYGMANATEVEFEAGSKLTTISTGAFGYAGLETVEIPASVTDIEKNAFYYAPALTTVTFAADSALANVGSYAFRNCTALTTCVFPAGASIGASVFYNCPNMQ